MAWIYWPPANCRRRGTVGLRGVSRMDAATKATWTYLRRPRTPTVPRHPTECQLLLLLLPLLLLLLLPLQVQGAALQKNTPYSGRGACAGSIRPSPRVIFLNSARLTDT